MLGVESTIADVAFGSAHSRCLRNVCFARDRIAVQRISLNNGDFDNAARHGIVVVKEKPSQPGATVITPAMTNLAIQTGSVAYCRTALQRPMQPSVRINRPDALLPEKCPVQVPLTPLAEAVPFAEPFGLIHPWNWPG